MGLALFASGKQGRGGAGARAGAPCRGGGRGAAYLLLSIAKPSYGSLSDFCEYPKFACHTTAWSHRVGSTALPGGVVRQGPGQ